MGFFGQEFFEEEEKKVFDPSFMTRHQGWGRGRVKHARKKRNFFLAKATCQITKGFH